MDNSTVPFERERDSDEKYEAVVDYDLRVNSVSLAAWTPQEGWAAAGECWLVVDWAYEIRGDSTLAGTGNDINDVDVTLTTTVGAQTSEDTVRDKGGRRGNSAEVATVVAVPIDTVDAQFSLAGSAEYELMGGSYVISHEGGGHVEFASDPLEVSFPDSRYAGAAGGQDGQQPDDVEETTAPGAQDDA